MLLSLSHVCKVEDANMVPLRMVAFSQHRGGPAPGSWRPWCWSSQSTGEDQHQDLEALVLVLPEHREDQHQGLEAKETKVKVVAPVAACRLPAARARQSVGVFVPGRWRKPRRPLPVTVEGHWDPDQTRSAKNKLQLYFQSKRKSGGGDCRVEAEDGGPRVAVFFRCAEVKERVLARENHEILLDNRTVKLRLISASIPPSSDSDSKTQDSQVEPGEEASAENKEESERVLSVSVVLDNVSHDTTRDLLAMLVENISGLDEGHFGLEIIWESSRAVVTFKQPADQEKFLAVSQSTQKLQKRGLTTRPLEAAVSVRLESLPPNVVKDMLELYFEKHWEVPDAVVLIPHERAAVATFRSPKVVESICTKRDYLMQSIPVKVYPYYESLGTALYGSERPTWKMPEPVTERVHHVIWKFLLMKKLLNSLNDRMRPHFCSVDLETPAAKLRPLPEFLKQKGLTAQRVDGWASAAKEAFCRQMSEYGAFECPANAHAWKAAEKDVRSAIGDDAFLVLDTPKGILTVAGRADTLKQIQAPVENLVLKAMDQMKRQAEGLSDVMRMSPAMFYILNHEGFKKAAQDISPDMKLSFNEVDQKLTITGLPVEVYRIKSWILEKNVGLSKKPLNIPPPLLDFLKTVDPMDMSQHLFTSRGIGAVYTIENKGLTLSGSSERVLAAAESKMKSDLSQQTLNVEDQDVLKLHLWVQLNQQLLDTYNSLTTKTVAIQIHPERKDKVTVAGFLNQVNEVADSLRDFIMNHSRVQETIRIKSCAVVQFIEKKKSEDWSGIAKDNDVEVRFDSARPKITLAGARLHVQKARSCFQELASGLSTDHFTVDKPGAKKYFQSHGSMLLSTIMTELSCVVVLSPENQEEEEEEGMEYDEVKNGHCYCKVKTASGVLVSVSKADICSFGVDAVVNAANEDLQHIGGLALALLKAAGPELQKISNDHVARRGKLRAGDAVVTAACNLPCRHVVHTVGPRFSDADRKTSVSRLKLAVKNSLTQAEAVNCSTVALPAISSGVFGFPVDLCAETIAEAVRDFCDASGGPRLLTEVHLVDNNDNTVRVLAAAVNTLFKDLGPTMTVPPPAAARGAEASGGYQLVQGQNHSQLPRGRPFGNRGRGGNHGGQNLGGYASRGGHAGSGRMEQTTAEGLKIILRSGNIQDQTTDVIVNTISEDMNLNQGAVSKAVLQGAGSGLQPALQAAAGASALPYGDVVVTDGFNLKCRKVFHAVCPFWDNAGGQAEEELVSIVRYCLKEAESLRMASLSFPAIGTGNLRFPRDVVSRVLLQEIHAYSRRRAPRHLREVAVVVHPSDGRTVDVFTREFKGQTGQRNVQREAREFNESPVSQSQQASASFGRVSSPSLGVHQIQLGPLSLEVSTGDITKEASDVIVNSSNQNFTLNSGVSKAILDGAGLTVQQECSQIVGSKGFQPVLFILTSAGRLPSTHILHAVGSNDPPKIQELVYSVLKFCEENKFRSVSFPALGTGQGGANPAAVADAMVEAVVDFVRKKQPRSVLAVKILIFQTVMMADFHKSMTRRAGEEVEERSAFTKIKDRFTSFFLGVGDERPAGAGPVLEREEFQPTAFELCADSAAAVSQARKRITELIVSEQAKRTITDPFIGKLSQADMDGLRALQRKLTVSIHLHRGQGGQEPNIHLEGLTRDVLTAESAVREILLKVERSENRKSKALLLSGLVEWQHQDRAGAMKPFDMFTNLQLEEALEKKQASVSIKIHNEKFSAQVSARRAESASGRRAVELFRKEVKADSVVLPPHWDNMKDFLQLFPLKTNAKEYQDVEAELTKTGLTASILSIERVQNSTLWCSFQLMKKHLEVTNNHTRNERRLFHGTAATAVDLINKQGFNRGYAGIHGAMLGNGSYFAVDPAYSAKGYAPADAAGHKRMYLSRVLVGDFTKGRQGLITPPCKPSGNPSDLYDSVVDQTANPTMFVVFKDVQAYPEYLITFI
ncbi:protein mono-ADP-ribosyltransferase PARP14-like [Cyclopterus lumpus]|uniref:protein mono-ADP-ribosyltransferase PARP14-like n=1 Tax=Cyclopterus lumpus TaxID=8103 RepID=UPI001485EDC3|nr:protein mono-ADP-ribosyltransferase PARP14-like [Cyclopterus lumpus]